LMAGTTGRPSGSLIGNCSRTGVAHGDLARMRHRNAARDGKAIRRPPCGPGGRADSPRNARQTPRKVPGGIPPQASDTLSKASRPGHRRSTHAAIGRGGLIALVTGCAGGRPTRRSRRRRDAAHAAPVSPDALVPRDGFGWRRTGITRSSEPDHPFGQPQRARVMRDSSNRSSIIRGERSPRGGSASGKGRLARGRSRLVSQRLGHVAAGSGVRRSWDPGDELTTAGSRRPLRDGHEASRRGWRLVLESSLSLPRAGSLRQPLRRRVATPCTARRAARLALVEPPPTKQRDHEAGQAANAHQVKNVVALRPRPA